MTGLAYPKPQPRHLRDAAVKAEEAKARKAAYAAVTKRDGKRCRYCLRPYDHHHHILPRSLGGADTTRNLILLCELCHRNAHAKVYRIDGNPDEIGGLTFTTDAAYTITGRDEKVTR